MDQQLSDINQKLDDIKKLLSQNRVDQQFDKLCRDAKYILAFISLVVIFTIFSVFSNFSLKLSCDEAAVLLAAISTLFTAFSFFLVALLEVKQYENKNG